MSEAERLALINAVPLILTALGTFLSAVASFWAVARSGKAKTEAIEAHKEAKATTDAVNGGLTKILALFEAANRAETKAARAEALGEAALQTATGAVPRETVVVPGTASDRRKAGSDS